MNTYISRKLKKHEALLAALEAVLNGIKKKEKKNSEAQ